MRPVVALGVLVTLVASSCSSVEHDAASVGDSAVTVDEFETLLQEFAARPEITNLQEDPATGAVPGDDARNWLTVLVRNMASTEFLAQNDEAVTDEDRQAVRDTIEADNDLLQFPDEIVDQFIDLQAATTARERIPSPDADELERRYDQSPASLGVVCVRHVLLDTEADAQDVIDELEAGAAMADLAVERSTDPSAVDNEGAIEGASGACIPTADAAQQLDPTFVGAAMTSIPGVPVGPTQTSFGWHVIEARPFDEVSDSLTTLYDDSAGALLFNGFMTTADIRVDPRYGRWDGMSATVVSLS
jgi:peptidyl-prolyl cis-trans isomerase C